MANLSAITAPAHGTDVPQLTVLMPAWNSASTIERALASVLEEHDTRLECVVIDDGSTDGTADIVQAVADRDPRVILLRLPTNGGVSNARNRGLAVARGEWLAFHDADDRMRPGGIAALMRPTTDPDVRAVVGQRIWTDGERTWLSPLYDIPDIREPGRKSIATHPGLLYYVAPTGKVFHRSLIDGLQFAGRVAGDQPWTIRALLRAGRRIEVIGETVFEWSRPHPDRPFETITTIARATAGSAVEIAVVVNTAFQQVCAEIDVQIGDEATRLAIKKAYFERLLRSDLSGPIRKAFERRDPTTGQLYEAVAEFVRSIPSPIIATSDALITHVLRPPAKHWLEVVPSARSGYWEMVRAARLADPRVARRIPWNPAIAPPFLLADWIRAPYGPAVATALLWIAATAWRALGRLRRR